MNAIDDRIEVHIESFNVDEQNKVNLLMFRKKHHVDQIFSTINKKRDTILDFNFQFSKPAFLLF